MMNAPSRKAGGFSVLDHAASWMLVSAMQVVLSSDINQHQGRHMPARTLSKMIILAGIIALPMQASAQSILCIGEHATGFKWVNHEWVKTDFAPPNFLFKKTEPDETCWQNIVERRGPISKIEKGYYWEQPACYTETEVGDSPMMPYSCVEKFHPIDTLAQIQCETLFDTSINVNGEFVRVQAYPIKFEQEEVEGRGRDSLSMVIGKCSRID